jgi:vesicle-fusing ATPase
LKLNWLLSSYYLGLPDENGRLHILNIHTSKMRKYGKIDKNVDLTELAALSKNFSGAEIEGLVRATQSCAMNRSVKVIFNQMDYN